MKKTYKFDELSDRVCITPKCNKHLKKRIVEQKPTAKRCFSCEREYQAGRQHHMSTAREVRMGLKPKRMPKIPKEGVK